jgi:hypothetical protein
MARKPGAVRWTDPGLLILGSLAAGPLHGYAIVRDVAHTSGLRLGLGADRLRLPAIAAAVLVLPMALIVVALVAIALAGADPSAGAAGRDRRRVSVRRPRRARPRRHGLRVDLVSHTMRSGVGVAGGLNQRHAHRCPAPASVEVSGLLPVGPPSLTAVAASDALESTPRV